MYEVGAWVICRSGGVWRVSAVEKGRVTLIDSETGASRDICREDDDIVRPLVSREKIEEVIDRVSFIPAIQASGEKSRLAMYEASMAMYDEIEWLKVIKTVYLRAESGRASQAEMEYGERAKRYLHGEIAVLLGLPPDEVEAHIGRIVHDDSW